MPDWCATNDGHRRKERIAKDWSCHPQALQDTGRRSVTFEGCNGALEYTSPTVRAYFRQRHPHNASGIKGGRWKVGAPGLAVTQSECSYVM
jgi:hypothetical protein